MKAKTPKQVLKAVEWILTNVGWTKGASFRDKNGKEISGHDVRRGGSLGSVCLQGALELVEVDSGPSRALAAGHIRIVNNLRSLVSFNDSPARTKQEVLAAVRKAINVFR